VKIALDCVQKTLSRANKKTTKLIGFIRLHTGMGGICAQGDLNHEKQLVAGSALGEK
jgi:hypothetical protein